MARNPFDCRLLVSPQPKKVRPKSAPNGSIEFESVAPVTHLETWTQCRDAIDLFQPLEYRRDFYRDVNPDTDSNYFEVTEERDFPRWLFRGEKSHAFELQPSIERVAHERNGGISEMEDAIWHEFWGRFRLYSAGLQMPEDRLSQLALMQHYGAPTRLLDFSFSAFVALFFAVVDRPKPDDLPCVWALDAWKIEETLRGAFGEDTEPSTCTASARSNREALRDFNSRLFETRPGAAQPWASILIDAGTNPRLDRQQGAFLFSGSGTPLCESVLHMMKDQSGWCKRFTIDPRIAEEVESRLHQMNVHHLTLFPDLNGLSHYSRRAGMLRLRSAPGPATQI